MTEKDSCFDDIIVLCKHGLLDYSFWNTDGGNSYIEYFEVPALSVQSNIILTERVRTIRDER